MFKVEQFTKIAFQLIKVLASPLGSNFASKIIRKGRICSNDIFFGLKTAVLAQKNSEATRALAMQEDILEKELGEIQKVLLAMQVLNDFRDLLTYCER